MYKVTKEGINNCDFNDYIYQRLLTLINVNSVISVIRNYFGDKLPLFILHY